MKKIMYLVLSILPMACVSALAVSDSIEFSPLKYSTGTGTLAKSFTFTYRFKPCVQDTTNILSTFTYADSVKLNGRMIGMGGPVEIHYSKIEWLCE